jgi:hypothetical protein
MKENEKYHELLLHVWILGQGIEVNSSCGFGFSGGNILTGTCWQFQRCHRHGFQEGLKILQALNVVAKHHEKHICDFFIRRNE